MGSMSVCSIKMQSSLDIQNPSLKLIQWINEPGPWLSASWASPGAKKYLDGYSLTKLTSLSCYCDLHTWLTLSTMAPIKTSLVGSNQDPSCVVLTHCRILCIVDLTVLTWSWSEHTTIHNRQPPPSGSVRYSMHMAAPRAQNCRRNPCAPPRAAGWVRRREGSDHRAASKWEDMRTQV